MTLNSLPDGFHPDPVIQRTLDWLEGEIPVLDARATALETRATALETALASFIGLRILRGIVNATTGTPVIEEGTGFTITDNGVGLYTINFTTAFADVPTVDVTGHVGVGAVNVFQAKLAQGTAVTVSAAQVLCYRTDTNAVIDSSFHFIAIGPA